ncbi:prepilin-type N-terminal cleavage/methylation domain-containing protein [Chloroflexota bacterium]
MTGLTRHESGATLMEMLVALAVLGTITVVFLSSMDYLQSYLHYR